MTSHFDGWHHEYQPNNEEIIERMAQSNQCRLVRCCNCNEEIPSALLDKTQLCQECKSCIKKVRQA